MNLQLQMCRLIRLSLAAAGRGTGIFGTPRAERKATVRVIWIDVTRLASGYETGGIPRVVRSFAVNLPRVAPRDSLFCFFSINSLGGLTNQGDWAVETLEIELERLWLGPIEVVSGDIVLMLDLAMPPRYLRPRKVRQLVRRGAIVLVIVYDLLPVTNPEWFPMGKRLLFLEWLRMTAEASATLSISETTKKRLETHWVCRGRNRPESRAITLGAETPSVRRAEVAPKNVKRSWTVLMVGTIDPRKGYLEALSAFELLWLEEFPIHLHILGNLGRRSAGVLEELEASASCHPQLVISINASEAELEKAYANSDLLLANALDEGLGLPLLEARARGLRVLARDIQIFRELTRFGVEILEVNSPVALAREVKRIVLDGQTPPPAGVPSWSEAATALMRQLG